MSARKMIVWVSLPLLVILLYWCFHAGTGRKNDLPDSGAVPPVRSSVMDAPVSPGTSSTTAVKSGFPKAPVAKPPSVSALREEAGRDVHVTPPALLRFGADLGVRMKSAKQSKAEAVGLLGELTACARPARLEESPVQARALCLVSARELEQAWPELHGQVKDLVENSDPQAIQLASKLHGFTRSPH